MYPETAQMLTEAGFEPVWWRDIKEGDEIALPHYGRDGTEFFTVTQLWKRSEEISDRETVTASNGTYQYLWDESSRRSRHDMIYYFVGVDVNGIGNHMYAGAARPVWRKKIVQGG